MYRLLKLIPAPTLVLILTAGPVFAESAGGLIQGGLTKTGSVAGYAGTEPSLPAIVGKVIQALLGVVGVVFLVLTVYAGIMYMTAGGDTAKVDKAKKIITNSVLGLIIVIGAYAFTKFVVDELAKATVTAQPVKK